MNEWIYELSWKNVKDAPFDISERAANVKNWNDDNVDGDVGGGNDEEHTNRNISSNYEAISHKCFFFSFEKKKPLKTNCITANA